MRILIVTPLFPPDIGDPAPYVKDLAHRLRPEHTVGVLSYGSLPEAIPGVTIESVSKLTWTPLRVLQMLAALYRTSRHYDVLYIQNGISVELPALLASLFLRIPIVLGVTDQDALRQQKNSQLKSWVFTHLQQRSVACVDLVQHDQMSRLSKPEMLPFPEDNDPSSTLAYEEAWQQHLDYLHQQITL